MGKTIVFAHQKAPGLNDMFAAGISIVNVNTGKVTSVVNNGKGWNFYPMYSPNGQWISHVTSSNPFEWYCNWGNKYCTDEWR